jgi:hypothetical protein
MMPFRQMVILAAAASAAMGSASAVARPAPPALQHFIEFRARHGAYVGHTLVAYGTQDAQGRVIEEHSAGFIPDDGIMGVIGPIHGSVGLDREDRVEPVTTRYRRRLTAAEYGEVLFAVRYLRANEHVWHVLFYNCNDFAIAVAESIGLLRPPSWMPPDVFVSTLRAMNAR